MEETPPEYRRQILNILHLHPEGRSFTELLEGIGQGRTPKRPLSRHLNHLMDEGMVRKVPITGEKRVQARYVLVPDSEKGAHHAFGTARDEILRLVAEKLPPIHAPPEQQASELTVLLDALLWCRKELLADLLRDALHQPKDEDAIHYFVGRTGYITECAEDHMLLALLERREAAPRALDIWLGHPHPRPADETGTSPDRAGAP